MAIPENPLPKIERLIAAPITRRGWSDRTAALSARLELVRNRQQPGGLVVAFLGSSGAGKSSLLNAIAGRDLAPVGATRPTTRRATVYCGQDALPSQALLEALGHPPVQTATGALGLVLLDLPDVDSVEEENRRYTERALLHAHVVLLVTTPESQADAAVRAFIKRRASDYRWAVVSNKKDRHREARDALLADLRGALSDAGVSPDRLFETSVAPGTPAEGVAAVTAWVWETAAKSPEIREALGLDQRRRLLEAGEAAVRWLESVRSNAVIAAAREEMPALREAVREAAAPMAADPVLRAMVAMRLTWPYPRPFGVLWELADAVRMLPHRLLSLSIARDDRAANALVSGLAGVEAERAVSGALDRFRARIGDAAWEQQWTAEARESLPSGGWPELRRSLAAETEAALADQEVVRPARLLWLRYNLLPVLLLLVWLAHAVVMHLAAGFAGDPHRVFEGIPSNEILFVLLVALPLALLLQGRVVPKRASFAAVRTREVLTRAEGRAVEKLVEEARSAAAAQDAPVDRALREWREASSVAVAVPVRAGEPAPRATLH